VEELRHRWPRYRREYEFLRYFHRTPLQFWSRSELVFRATVRTHLVDSAFMAKSSKKSLGGFELFVLAAIKKLGVRAYGAEITRYLSGTLSRDITVAQVYMALARLEEGNLVQSEFTQPTGKRGGRARKLYQLRPYGVQMLTETASTLKILMD